MAVAFWLGRFLSKLQWNLVNAAKRERRYAKMQRRARRKQDGLASQLEDLEYRVMLSGTTAVNDQAVLNQIGVPITLDVLSNDVSGNGALDIVSASIVGGSGTVIIVQGNSAASGAAARDRVQVTVSSNISGNATVQYTIQDQLGNQSTAQANLDFSEPLGPVFTYDSDGSLIVASGLGNGHLISPTSGYLPTEWGAFTYSKSASESYTQYDAGIAISGTQSITKSVSTTSNGVANWSYAEDVIWTYNVQWSDGNGNSSHLWGSKHYVFSSVSVAGVITTTLVYSESAHHDNSRLIISTDSQTNLDYWGATNSTVTVVNVNSVVETGMVQYSSTYVGGSLGAGVYSKLKDGGSISGTTTSSSYDYNNLQMSKFYTELASGGFAVVGTVVLSGNGYKNYGYSGGGTYLDGRMTTTAAEKGDEQESYNYTGSGTFANGIGWTLLGTGQLRILQNFNYAFSGTGGYSREFHGGTIIGVERSTGENKGSSDLRFDYGLASNGWYVTGGFSRSSGESVSENVISGSGTYVYTQTSPVYSETLSGNMREMRNRSSESRTTVNGLLNAASMQWSYAGSGDASGSNTNSLSYEGSGVYSRSINGGTVSGVASESYESSASGNFATSSTLNNLEWQTVGGGATSGVSTSHNDYSGTGGYVRVDVSGNEVYTYAGIQRQKGSSKITENRSTTFSIGNGITTRVGGGVSESESFGQQHFSGSAAYARLTSDGESTISGVKNEEIEDFEDTKTTVHSSLSSLHYGLDAPEDDSGWAIVSGSGNISASGYAKRNWSGSANYNKSWTDSGNNFSATYWGNVRQLEIGNANQVHFAESDIALDGNQNWYRVSGAGNTWGSDSTTLFVGTSGTFEKNIVKEFGYEAEVFGTHEESELRNDSNTWNETKLVVGGQFVTVSGSAVGDGSAIKVSSNSGVGTYEHRGGAYHSRISGVTKSDNFLKDESSYTTFSDWDLGKWTTSGTLTASGKARHHSEYSGQGAMNTLSIYDPEFADDPNNFIGTVKENGYTNGTSKETSVFNFVGESSNYLNTPSSGDWKISSGVASSWGDGYSHEEWNGSGAYASSGNDPRYGDWRVSGRLFASGYEDSWNTWDRSKIVAITSLGIKGWTTIGGSASDWGKEFESNSRSGSGSWSNSLPYPVSGTMSQSGSDTFELNWDTRSLVDLSQSNAELPLDQMDQENWIVVSGHASTEFHKHDRTTYGYSSAPYRTIGTPWMSGTMHAYEFTETFVDADWEDNYSVLKQSWVQVSGNATTNVFVGDGRGYAASGSSSVGGVTLDGTTWLNTAHGAQSGGKEYANGGYVNYSYNSGAWKAVSSGISASGFEEEHYDWHKSYTSNEADGDWMTRTGNGTSHYRTENLILQSSLGATSSNRDEYFLETENQTYASKSDFVYRGLPGKLTQGLSTTWQSSGNANYYYFGRIGDGNWLTRSGEAHDESTYQESALFEFETSYASGAESHSASLDVGFMFRDETKEHYSTNVQLPLASPPASGYKVKWNLSSGTNEQEYVYSTHYESKSAGRLLTPIFGIDSAYKSNEKSTYDEKWKRESVSSGSGWQTTGSGRRDWFSENDFGYSGRETYTTDGGSGTKWEEKDEKNTFKYKIETEWVDFGSGGRPYGEDHFIGASGSRNFPNGPEEGIVGTFNILNSSGSGKSIGRQEFGFDEDRNWAAIVYGAVALGNISHERVIGDNFEIHAQYRLLENEPVVEQNRFDLISGSGTGNEYGHETIDASASGTYSRNFDGTNGVVAGNVSTIGHRHWEFDDSFNMTLEVTPLTKTWVKSSSGQGSFESLSKAEYSGSGSYDVTSTNSNGYHRSKATISESGLSESSTSGSVQWENNDWDYDWNHASRSVADSSYSSNYEYSYAYSYNQNGHNNLSTSVGNGTNKEKYHWENENEETYVESHHNGVLNWEYSGTGSYSGHNQIESTSFSRYDWNNNYSSPTLVSFSNGYSSNTDSAFDRWEHWGNYSWELHDDGSSVHSETSGGSHAWNRTSAWSFTHNWGETYLSSSGSGGGGASSTGGADAGANSSGSGGFESWSYSSNYSTGPTQGTNGDNGDGKLRWAGSDIPLGIGEQFRPSLPSLDSPNLGMDSVPNLDTLGWWQQRLLNANSGLWGGIADVLSYWDWAHDSVTGLADWAGEQIIRVGLTLSDITGIEAIDTVATFAAGAVSLSGELYANLVIDSTRPDLLTTAMDYRNGNLGSRTLDGIQDALDVAGFIPGAGALPDLASGAISQARGDTEGALLSYAAAIPVVGDFAGIAYVVGNLGYAAHQRGLQIRCKVTGDGCFVSGTKVWVSSSVDSEFVSDANDEQPGDTLSKAIVKERIETIPIGSRVVSHNPREWEWDGSLEEPHESSWEKANFSMQREDGSWIDVEMIRPKAYWEAQNASVGEYIFVEFDELDATGLALVNSFEPCPPIAPGPGRVVTARITTRQVSELVEVTTENGECVVGTPQHPVWSVDRDDWVPLGELEEGEFLWTEDGPVEIRTIRELKSAESVYNLEVHGDHTFLVAESGILVHNAGGIYKKIRKLAKRLQYVGRTPGKNSKTGKQVIERLRAENKVRTDPDGTVKFFNDADQSWYDIKFADMAHVKDAVSYWNRIGRYAGAKSPTVRKWIKDPNNYTLEHQKDNRSKGAKLGENYQPEAKGVGGMGWGAGSFGNGGY